MKHMDLVTLMDILDWFDDDLYDYLNHILLPSWMVRSASSGRCPACASMRGRW